MTDEAIRSEEVPVERLKPITEALRHGSEAERADAAVELTRVARPAVYAGLFAELQATIALIPKECVEELRTIAILVIRPTVGVVEQLYAQDSKEVSSKPAYKLLKYLVQRLGESDMVAHAQTRQARYGSKKYDSSLVYEVAMAATAFPYANDTHATLIAMRTTERLVGAYQPGSGENDIRALIPVNTARALTTLKSPQAALDFLKTHAEQYADDPLVSGAYYYVLKKGARELYATGKKVADLVALADRYVKPTLGKLETLPPEFGDWAKEKPAEGEEDTRTPYEQFLGFLADEYTAWQEEQKPQRKAA